MTEKLFYVDSFIKDFEATVLECNEAGDVFHIRLDRTAFFPEGGGQSGDCGYIGDIEVFDTHEKDGEIWHYSKLPATVGEKYSCKLDFVRTSGSKLSKLEKSGRTTNLKIAQTTSMEM